MVDFLEIFHYYDGLHEKFERKWQNSSKTEDHKSLMFLSILGSYKTRPVVKFLCYDVNYRHTVQTVPSCFKVLSCKSLEELKKVRENPSKTPVGWRAVRLDRCRLLRTSFPVPSLPIFSASFISVHHKPSDNLVTSIMFRRLKRTRLHHTR